jgi:hypothetical protein
MLHDGGGGSAKSSIEHLKLPKYQLHLATYEFTESYAA